MTLTVLPSAWTFAVPSPRRPVALMPRLGIFRSMIGIALLPDRMLLWIVAVPAPALMPFAEVLVIAIAP